MLIAPLILALLATPVASEEADGPVILDFTASWCNPCQQMKPAVAQLISKGYPVKAVDYDRSPLVQKYKVSSIPTFIVVSRDGRELARTQGYQPARNIAELYNNAQDPSEPGEQSDSLAQSDPAATADDNPDSVPERKNPDPWKTVVRIKIENNLGGQRSWEFGSGTIIHSTPEETIILTCAHIFKIDGLRRQYPPRQFPLKIEVHLSDGILRQLSERDQNDGFRAGVHMVERHEGQAIDYDFGGDVGLIRIRPGRRLPATPVVPAEWTAKTGLNMTTVGCSESNDATAWSTRITRPLIRGVAGSPNYEAIECIFAPKQGRSGGGLYTLDGQLAGVCDFAEPQGNKGLYATPRTIHRFLDKNSLKFCYTGEADPRAGGSGSLVAQGRGAPRATRPNEADTLRSQSPDEPIRKKLTIPPPEDLQIPTLAADLERPSTMGNRRRPAFVADTVDAQTSGSRIRSAGEVEPLEATPAEISMDAGIDPDPFDVPENRGREAESAKQPEIAAPRPASGTIWKARTGGAVPLPRS